MTANNWFRTEGSDLIYTPSRVSSFEILRSSSDNGLPRLERKQIRPEEIEAWLTDSQMQASKSSSSLRILFGECSQLSHIDPTSSQFLRIPFSRHKFERVLENMRVQPQFVWALEDPSAQVSRFRGIMPKDWSYIFKLGIHVTGFYTISVSYNHEIRLTSVLLLAQTHFHDIGMILAMLYWRNYKVLVGQPMLVPFLNSIVTLNAIEEEMGQHTYTNRYKGNPLEANFVNTTTALNGNNTRLATNEARLKSLISTLSQIYDYIIPVIMSESSKEDESGLLMDHVQHLKGYCENLLLSNEAEQKRTASQLAVVYNFMAQKDNLLNLTLAEDSKAIAASSRRDSRAMKTISVVTMIFLPGTYIAALFAMPLFKWDAPSGSSVLNERFWYYWVVTIPLTAFVFVIWISSMPVYNTAKKLKAGYARKRNTTAQSKSQPSGFHNLRNAEMTHRARRRPPDLSSPPQWSSSIIQT